MRQKIAALAMGMCAVFSPECKGVVVNMDSKRVLSLTMSKQGINRICVEGDEINNVLVNPVYLQSDIQLDESGQLFVLGNDSVKEAFVSLVTSSGAVQDLKLVFESKHPEPIFLHFSRVSPLEAPIPLGKLDIHQTLQKVVGGNFEGWVAIQEKGESRVATGLEAVPQKHYVSDDGRYVLIECSLEGQEGRLPSPSVFKREMDVALVFTDKHLSQSTKLFIIKERKTL